MGVLSGNNEKKIYEKRKFMKIQIVIVNLSTKAVQSDQNIVLDVYSKCIEWLKMWKFEISSKIFE